MLIFIWTRKSVKKVYCIQNSLQNLHAICTKKVTCTYIFFMTGVSKAVSNVNDRIAPALINKVGYFDLFKHHVILNIKLWNCMVRFVFKYILVLRKDLANLAKEGKFNGLDTIGVDSNFWTQLFIDGFCFGDCFFDFSEILGCWIYG